MKVIKCDAHLQERLEGGSGELQACQSDLCTGQGPGRDHLEGCCKQGIRLRQQGFMKRRCFLTQPQLDKSPAQWMREKQWIFSTWTLLKPLMPL